MTVGLLLPSPLLADLALAAPLATAALPAPALGGVVVGFATSGASTHVDESPFTVAHSGARQAAHGLVWFDHIHVEPRARNLGFVLSEQTFDVEVFNAFMDRAKMLTAVDIEGPAGIDLATPPALPTHYAGSASLTYTLKAITNGAPFIANRVVWTFTGVDPAGTDLALTGVRLVPFPLSPNWASPVTERYGLLNDLLTSYDDTEQRVQLKAVPLRGLTYELLCVEARETQILHALLFGWQSRPYGVPWWQDATPLTAPVAQGAFALNCSTSNRDFEAGGLAMLWRDAATWEVLTIDSLTSTQLNFTSATRDAWPLVGTQVIPVRLGRFSDSEEIDWVSQLHSSMKVSFDIEAVKS